MVAIARSEEPSARMTSTSGMRCTGLKKCMPQKFSGRFSDFAKRFTEIVEVLVVMIVSSDTSPSARSAPTP